MSDNTDLLKACREIEAERAAMETQRNELMASLELVMSWIDEWSPDFIHDEDWIADSANIRADIAKAKGGQS